MDLTLLNTVVVVVLATLRFLTEIRHKELTARIAELEAKLQEIAAVLEGTDPPVA